MSNLQIQLQISITDTIIKNRVEKYLKDLNELFSTLDYDFNQDNIISKTIDLKHFNFQLNYKFDLEEFEITFMTRNIENKEFFEFYLYKFKFQDFKKLKSLNMFIHGEIFKFFEKKTGYKLTSNFYRDLRDSLTIVEQCNYWGY